MKARIDILLSRAQIDHFFKILTENSEAISLTVNCTVDVAEVKFCDSYTKLVCGTEICSTTAVVRCK